MLHKLDHLQLNNPHSRLLRTGFGLECDSSEVLFSSEG